MVGLQTLDLAILVRVQASQPNNLNRIQETKLLSIDVPSASFDEPSTSFDRGQNWGQLLELGTDAFLTASESKYSQKLTPGG